MAPRFWLGTTSTDNTNAANWSASSGGAGGASVPGTGDTATFDGNGNNACTWTAGMTLGGLSVVAGYTATLNLVTFNLTMASGANVTLAGGGTFNAGTGTIALTNGDFNNRDQTTWTRGSATVSMGGTGNFTSRWAQSAVYNLTIQSGATITIPYSGGIDGGGTLTVNGTASVNSGNSFNCGFNSSVILGNNSAVTGLGFFSLYKVTTFTRGTGTTLDVANFRTFWPITNGLPAGSYLSTNNYFAQEGAGNTTTFKFNAGSFTFSGTLTFRVTSTSSFTIDLSTNAVTDVTVNGNMVFDLDSTGTLAVTDSGRAVNWTIQGNVVDEITGGGTFTWTVGTGTMTFSGTSNQAIDFHGLTPEPFIVNKAAGEIAFESGTFVAGGACAAYNFTCSGDAAVDMATYNLTLADGGDFLADGSGTFDAGTGTITLTSGDFNNKDHSGTWTEATSTVVMSGTGKTITTHNSNDFYNLTINGNTEISASTTSSCDVENDLTVAATKTLTVSQTTTVKNAIAANGIISIATNKYLYAYESTLTVGAAGQITGAGSGYVAIYNGTLDNSAGGTYSPPSTIMHFDNTVNAGTYGGAFTCSNKYGASALTFGGAIVFTGHVVFDSDHASLYTIGNSGNYTITCQANVSFTETVGTMSITEGTGGFSFTGTADQVFVNSASLDSIGAVVVNKTGATDKLTLNGPLTCSTFTFTDGDVDPNGQTITCSGNCGWAAGTTFDDESADAMNGCEWVVGGNFTADGQTLSATAAWVLTVTGTAVASGTGNVEYGDASGGTEIEAHGWVNNGHNQNWDFLASGQQAGVRGRYLRPMRAFVNT